MADFDLTQSGQEIQNILDGAAMQTDLTAEIERAEQAEQQLQGNIDIEETRAKAAEKQNADDIDVIEGKIPAAASSENQLADKAFVNSSIATATATYRGAYNLVSDLHLTTDATEQQIAAALAGAISTADNNDYCFVQIPTSDATPTQIAAIERYKFNGTAWAYEYTLNNSGFTADQWAALNSGITTGLVAKLAALPTNDELTLLLGGKQDVLTFDNVPTEGSNNPVKSGGVKSAIDSEKERAQGAEQANAGNIAQIIAMIPAAASSENQLADKNFVNSSIATNTATYRGAYNEVSDLSLTVDATHEQIAAALAGAISTADNNDYCFVQIPTAVAAPTQIAAIERYKFNGTAWAYEYTLNNSGFTADQWAAINSGITSGLVAKLAALPTNDDLATALAGKQPMLTFDNVPTDGSNNPVKSGGVYAAIAEEAGTRAAAIAAIVALIPSAASALNQLADKAFVNSAISTATAVFKGTFNVVADLELNYNASQSQIALMLGSKIASAANNDYCFVQIPTSNETPLEIARTDRYKYNGTAWAYEYTLNNSGFTAAQWAAINSGITSLLKDKLIDLPTATELATQLAAKQNALTFDTTPTEGSTNPVTSGGIHAAIDVEKERAEAAEEALDTNKADKATTLAGYGITDAYNKTEVNNLVSTPHQNYVTVATYASLPASGSTDTIYRVSSYDGANNQVDDTVYSEYAWDGTQYVFLDVKSQIDEVFDITVYNSNTKYADLAAALGVDGANIPATLRRGGMSVKFVQSSDNNYIQARLMHNLFTVDTTKWQVVDNELVEGSKNLITGGAAVNAFTKKYLLAKDLSTLNSINGKIWDGEVGDTIALINPSYLTDTAISMYIDVNEGDSLLVSSELQGGAYKVIFCNSSDVIVSVSTIGEKEYIIEENVTRAYINRRIDREFKCYLIKKHILETIDKRSYDNIINNCLAVSYSNLPYIQSKIWNGEIGDTIALVSSSYTTNAAIKNCIDVKEGDSIIINSSLGGSAYKVIFCDASDKVVATSLIENKDYYIENDITKVYINRKADADFECYHIKKVANDHIVSIAEPIVDSVANSLINEKSLMLLYDNLPCQAGKVWDGEIGNAITLITSSYNKNAAISNYVPVTAGDRISVHSSTIYGSAEQILICNDNNVIVATYKYGEDLLIPENGTRAFVNRGTDADFFFIYKKKEYFESLPTEFDFNKLLAPSPQKPANDSSDSDFNAETVTSEQLYAAFDSLMENNITPREHENYITRYSVIGKDASNNYDIKAYILTNRDRTAWRASKALYAWENGSTVIYTDNRSPRIGDNLYSDINRTDFGYMVSAYNSASQSLTANGVSYTRKESANVDEDILWTNRLYTSAYPTALLYNKNNNPIGSVQLTDNESFTYDSKVYYRCNDKDYDTKRKATIVLWGNEHGPQSDPNEPSIILYRLAKDLLDGCLNNAILSFLRQFCKVVIIPCANPYGVTTHHRNNANNVNINRNYDTIGWEVQPDVDKGEYAGDQNETQFIMNLCNDIEPNVAIDVHCLGYITENNNGRCHYDGYIPQGGMNSIIRELMLEYYNLLYSSYGQADPENSATGSDWIYVRNWSGGLIEMNAGFYNSVYNGKQHTSQVMVADYALLLNTIRLWYYGYNNSDIF